MQPANRFVQIQHFCLCHFGEMSELKRHRQTDSAGFQVVVNDQTPDMMILLTGLKNIFQKQLPKMPKEYIARLVYDRNHISVAVVRHPLIVLGGITYRPFVDRNFAEIVFCAIASTEQVQGYGSRLMSHVKNYVNKRHGTQHFLTYADNYAIGYFKKQVRLRAQLINIGIYHGYHAGQESLDGLYQGL